MKEWTRTLDLDPLRAQALIAGRCVLVTGAGGSIGGELCRQIAPWGPRRLVVLDHSENGALSTHQALCHRHPEVESVIAIGSVRDRVRMEHLLRRHRPELIIHAAAHKHLPLMEEAPEEAVKNNVGGTLVMADLAGEIGCEHFVFISTDKAVNPSCVMGRTKRLGERMVSAMSQRHPGTRYLSVRFGNVLGSAGSVVPLFRQQIALGGPVQVTHPEVTRYFMTIPEAAGLVLAACTMARGGEIFVLDMGEPIPIVRLAEQLIRLSGLQPYRDIGIVFTGLRPGEKLHEELYTHDCPLKDTDHPRIKALWDSPADGEALLRAAAELCRLAQQGRVEKMQRRLKDLCTLQPAAHRTAGETALL